MYLWKAWQSLPALAFKVSLKSKCTHAFLPFSLYFFLEQLLCIRLTLGIVGRVTEWRSLCYPAAYSLTGQKKHSKSALEVSGAEQIQEM